MHKVPCALPLALESEGNSNSARIAMIAITTSSSIKVNPPLKERNDFADSRIGWRAKMQTDVDNCFSRIIRSIRVPRSEPEKLRRWLALNIGNRIVADAGVAGQAAIQASPRHRWRQIGGLL